MPKTLEGFLVAFVTLMLILGLLRGRLTIMGPPAPTVAGKKVLRGYGILLLILAAIFYGAQIYIDVTSPIAEAKAKKRKADAALKAISNTGMRKMDDEAEIDKTAEPLSERKPSDEKKP
jgi:hypothetical protein